MSEPLALVTGATGFIAGHTIRDLLDHGYRVRGTVRSLARPERVQHLVDYSEGKPALTFVEADLSKDEGWAEAVEGCDFVVHMASPFPAKPPDDEDELIRPAVEGTLRVLKAAEAAGVKRVAMTSSTAAVINCDHGERPLTEADWSDPAMCSPYPKSKTLAERAAWDFHASLEGEGIELVVLNPCLVTGPVLSASHSTSIEIFRRLMSRALPACPHINFSMVDVRDVAAAHRLALERPEAAGNRYILANGQMWMRELARVLAAEFGPLGYRVPTGHLPYWVLWAVSWFDKSVRLVLPNVGEKKTLISDKVRKDLGWEPMDLAQSARDTGHALIQHGVVAVR